jgi:DNA-binding response OmpR family regulator
MTAILRRQSFAVSEAGSVAEAVRKLADAPDWVLLDLMLPDGSGCGVLRSVRDRGIKSRVCVITGAAPGLIEQARMLGPNHVLRKPLDLARLLSILAT